MTVGTELIDGEEMLIKSAIPEDAPSVCVEDFCGYSNPGHFPLTMSVDYFPTMGFSRFTGEWWNVPDMPCDREPTELEANVWARQHGASHTYVPEA